MTEPIHLRAGRYGRISILRLSHYLVEHAHADKHLQYWLGGSENPVSVDGVPIPFNRHRAVAINSWQSHASPKYQLGEHTTFLLLYLRNDWLEELCSKLDTPVPFPRASFEITGDVQHAVTRVCTRVLESRHRLDEQLTSLVEKLVVRSLLQVHSAQERIVDTVGIISLDPRIDHAIRVMRQNLDARLSFQRIAADSGLSRPHFFALFRQSLNVSPNVYWNTLRMETAIRRLARTEVPLGELAGELGFSEPANFSRFFKQHTGVCPSLYRSAAVQ